MKSATQSFINFLASANEIIMAEVYTITLVDGTVLRFTTFDQNLIVDGQTFLSGPPNFVRSEVEETLGISKVGTLSLEIYANLTDMVEGVPILQKIARGDFDKAQVTVERLFMDENFVQKGSVIRFVGNIGDLDELGRVGAKFTCTSKVEDLNVPLPRNILQPTCVHTLFDAGCTLAKSSFGKNGIVQPGSTVNKLLTNLIDPDSYYDNGQLVFTSGTNNGHVVAVKKYASTIVNFAAPLPAPPNAGDTFTAYPGCDKTQTTCTAKFFNLRSFRGFPYVPAPETAL
jgi:uncharacterized phage protein (TIGR02218 family)